MAVRLSSSYLFRNFQLLAKLDSDKIPESQVFDRASTMLYEWTIKKFSYIFRQLPDFKTSFDDKKDGIELGIIYEPEQGRFVLRGAHPDHSVPGRIWTTDVEVLQQEDSVLFAARLSTTSPKFCSEEVPFSSPSFIRSLVYNIGISDVIPLQDTPHLISATEDVEEFYTFLGNNRRFLPVILLTPCFRTEDGFYDSYMMDGTALSKQLLGCAHIFCITPEANTYFTNLVGQKWSAFNGAVRSYYPHLSFDDSNYYQHPLMTQPRIALRNTIDSDTSDGPQDICMADLESHIRNFLSRCHIIWDDEDQVVVIGDLPHHLDTTST